MLESTQYRFRDTDASTAQRLEREGMPQWLSRLYAARGIGSLEDTQPRLNGLLHYGAILNIDASARRLARAIEEGQRIVVVGDYDADGATATATAVLGLRMLGSKDPAFVVPDRFKHGYGLSPDVVLLAAEHKPQLLITVDNGIAAFSGIDKARTLGIDVLVTDHHLAGDRIPETPWIVNPNQPDCPFEGKNTAGVGVLFYTLLATRALMAAAGKFDVANKPKLEDLLDLVALGTVADVVKLDANNRRLVSAGLQRMRSGRARPLINALFELAGREMSYAACTDLGFFVGPRINAAGRMEDMSLGIQGMLQSTPAAAYDIAQALDVINRDRKERQRQMESEAEVLIEDAKLAPNQASLVLYQSDWHEGVVGLVASRVKERYWRPSIVFCDDKEGHLKGSGRSIPGLHMRDAIDLVSRHCPGSILKFGGHAMAAGLTIARESLPAFRAAFEQVCSQWLSQEALQRTALLDQPPEFSDITYEMAAELESRVWGQGIEPPVFGSQLPIVQQDVLKDAHLRLTVDVGGGNTIKGICFGRTEPIKQSDMVAWQIDPQRWKGRMTPQIRVVSVFPD